ncbi:paraquat-inducible protein A [Microbulbifer hydrolyticus]|uniref:Paraquat-inducible protein A n=1 Tax=Microbulbifer hydrolyticus TaxID=48074 RepID=A0A6P1T7T5_9GAMM|nr:paraquat-inducible protein A [Microbulbifer hydrolyticus]MBB5211119.1 paraquat-inducible protein A [Microbulbifer hydrolyticus]QHQ38097.1 paraquat-inducible protein A [Microbulbifer hydrolyticus]
MGQESRQGIQGAASARSGLRERAQEWKRACHQCDLLLTRAHAPVGERLTCARCGATLHRNMARSVAHTAALSLSGLLLFIPSATLPLLEFSMFSFGAENTLMNGVQALFAAGYLWLASLVLFCSVVAPLGKFLLLAFICWGSAWARLAKPVARALRWYHHLQEWGMLDVYMLGILVALVKMSDLGKMTVEPGLYCFVAMMVVSSAATVSFDAETVWARLARRAAGTAAGARPEVKGAQ